METIERRRGVRGVGEGGKIGKNRGKKTEKGKC